MKRFLLYLSVCCWALLAACTEEPLGNGDGNVPPTPPGAGGGTQVDSMVVTTDGQPPYLNLQENELRLEAFPSRLQSVWFETNLAEPPVVEVVSEEPFEQFVKTGSLDNYSLEFEPEVNYTDLERVNSIRFKTRTDSVLATYRVIQERGAVYHLAEETATVNGLKFRYTTNGNVQYVFYGLSHKELANEAEVVSFLERNNMDKNDKVGEMPLVDGARDFTLTFEGLNPQTPYYLYVLGAPNKNINYGNYQCKTVSTAVLEDKHDLVMTVSANRANDFTVILPFGNRVEGTVSWGDGTTETYTSGLDMIKHQYRVSKATNFTVRFKGTLEVLGAEASAPQSHIKNTLIAINQWGVTGLRQIDLGGFASLTSIAPDTEGGFASVEHFGVDPYGGSFGGTSIESIPDGLFKYATQATSFDDTFGYCEKLKSIPQDLFKYTVNVTSFNGTFAGCKQLEAIPQGLFDYTEKANSFVFTFARCEKIQQIPDGLFAKTPDAINFRGTFSRCKALQTIPDDLFANCKHASRFGQDKWTDYQGGYQGGGGVFEECISLQRIPENLFASCTAAGDMSYAFRGCKALQAIPAGLLRNNRKLAKIQGIFEDCTGLLSIPQSLFDHNRELTNVQSAFENCKNVTGESPYTLIEVDGKTVKAHLYERRLHPTEFTDLMYYVGCFAGCTNLTDIDKMVWEDTAE